MRVRHAFGPTAVGVAVLLLAALAPAALASGGDLDVTFGGDGKVHTQWPTADAWGTDVAVQPDGAIVVVGGAGGKFALARFGPHGALDTSFGGDGKVRTKFRGEAQAGGVAVQPDGAIVVVGRAGGQFALARHKRHGALDTSFGGDGKVRTEFWLGDAGAVDVAIQPDGKILVAGSTAGEWAVARYEADGTLDTSFGRDGKVRTDFTSGPDNASALVIQSDGKIVVVGRAGYRGFALARYRRGGSLDSSFGDEGKVRTFFGSLDSVRASADGVAIQEDGKIVAAGWAGGNYVRVALARYEVNGTLDTSFGGDGRVRTDFGDSAEAASDVAIQANGKIVIAGMAAYYKVFALARYLTNGSLDRSFGTGGKVTTEFDAGDAWADALAMQAGGKIVAVGTLGDASAGGIAPGDFALARYLLN